MKITNTLDANSNKIVNLTDATNPQDAVTLAQLDARVTGLRWKELVRAATTADIVLSGAQTIDGISIVAGDRVLVKNQTTASANGIYVAAAGAWARAVDFDLSAEVIGAVAPVSEGTTQGNTIWLMSTDAPVTLDSTNLVFTQINSGSGSYTAGSGISFAGSVISIDTTVTARRATAAIGDGIATTLTFTHNLNTRDVVVSVYDAATYTGVICDWVANGVNTVQLTFSVAPTSGQYRVLVIG